MSEKKEASKDKDFNPFLTGTVNSMRPQTRVRITFKDSCNNVKLFNMAEIDAPGGFTLTLGLPFPIPEKTLKKFAESIKLTGGVLEVEE